MEVNDASGKPTRQLTEDQYREWVRQTVSGEIWRKFAAALSIFGITTIYGVWSYTSNVTDKAIQQTDKAIQQSIKTESSAIADRLNSRINDEITYQVKHNKLVETAAKQTVTQLTEQNLIDTELRKLIVTQSQNILRGQDASLRELALQQVLLFGEPKQKAEAINLVLENPSNTGSVFQRALRQYSLPENGRDQNEILQNALKQALISPNDFTAESWAAFRSILGRRAHIRFACHWIRSNSAELGRTGNTPLQEVVKKIAEAGGPGAAEEFVDWIASRETDLVMLGLHGLANVQLSDSTGADQTKLRHGLLLKAVTSLTGIDDEQDGLSDFLLRSYDAIQRRDQAALRRYASSQLASTRIRDLFLNLSRGNRNTWALAGRDITSADKLREYGNYETEGPASTAYRGLASLLDVGPKSEDWSTLILPLIQEAKGSWTESGPARLAVNAWVQKLQLRDAPESSVDVVARLFVEAHVQHNIRMLASSNLTSYRFLIGKASRDVISSFLDRAPRFIGVADRGTGRGTRDAYDDNEAIILSNVLTRSLRDRLLTEDRLVKLRTGLLDRGALQSSQSVWLAAAGQTVGKKDVLVNARDAGAREANIRRIISTLAEVAMDADRPKDAVLSPNDAVALLFIVTNPVFLSIPSIQSAAESANLHLLARQPDRFKGEPQTLGLAETIALEAGKVFRWVGRLSELQVQRMDSEPIPLTQDVTWLSFERRAERLAQVAISESGEMNAIVIDSNERVLSPEIIPATDGSSPALIRIPDAASGTMFLRLRVQAFGESTFAALQHEEFYRATSMVRPKSGSGIPDIRTAPVTIQTNGSDDIWFRLDARAGATYVLHTSMAPAAASGSTIDTVIEVWNPENDRRLYEDDDSGEGYASRLSFRASRSGPYHILVRNIGSGHGTFTFQVTQR